MSDLKISPIIDNKKNSRKQTAKEVAVSSLTGLGVQYVGKKELGLLYRKYKQALGEKPYVVDFGNEIKYAKELTDFCKKNTTRNTTIKNLIKNLSQKDLTPKICRENAAKIINQKEFADAPKYTQEFFDFAQKVNSKTIPNEELVKIAEDLLKNKKVTGLAQVELAVFAKNPTETNLFLFNPKRIASIKNNATVYNYAKKILLDPKLESLAEKMFREKGLDKKSIQYVFKTQQEFANDWKGLKSSMDLNCKKIDDKFKIMPEDNFFQTIYKKSAASIQKIRLKKRYKMSLLTAESLFKGTNAAFFPSSKIAKMPMWTDRSFAVFHELGHAMNNVALPKIISSTRIKMPKYLLPITLGCSLISPKRKDGIKDTKELKNGKEKMQNGLLKAQNFIKNHIFAIALIIKAPTLLEEGMASRNGLKFLKENVDTNFYKQLQKRYAKAFGSYVAQALIIAGSFKLAVYVKEHVQNYLQLRNEKSK